MELRDVADIGGREEITLIGLPIHPERHKMMLMWVYSEIGRLRLHRLYTLRGEDESLPRQVSFSTRAAFD